MGSMRLTFAIHDVDCQGRVVLVVQRTLATVPGVCHAYVNPVTEMAYVVYDPALTDLAQLVATVARAGVRVGEIRVR